MSDLRRSHIGEEVERIKFLPPSEQTIAFVDFVRQLHAEIAAAYSVPMPAEKYAAAADDLARRMDDWIAKLFKKSLT